MKREGLNVDDTSLVARRQTGNGVNQSVETGQTSSRHIDSLLRRAINVWLNINKTWWLGGQRQQMRVGYPGFAQDQVTVALEMVRMFVLSFVFLVFVAWRSTLSQQNIFHLCMFLHTSCRPEKH